MNEKGKENAPQTFDARDFLKLGAMGAINCMASVIVVDAPDIKCDYCSSVYNGYKCPNCGASKTVHLN